MDKQGMESQKSLKMRLTKVTWSIVGAGSLLGSFTGCDNVTSVPLETSTPTPETPTPTPRPSRESLLVTYPRSTPEDSSPDSVDVEMSTSIPVSKNDSPSFIYTIPEEGSSLRQLIDLLYKVSKTPADKLPLKNIESPLTEYDFAAAALKSEIINRNPDFSSERAASIHQINLPTVLVVGKNKYTVFGIPVEADTLKGIRVYDGRTLKTPSFKKNPFYPWYKRVFPFLR
jgi:hypothetical protein